MNYVRKLGFEETPDYDFLRELFTKVLKTLGEPEDGVFDWMLLNGGKGWEAGHVRSASTRLTYLCTDARIDFGPLGFRAWRQPPHSAPRPSSGARTGAQVLSERSPGRRTVTVVSSCSCAHTCARQGQQPSPPRRIAWWVPRAGQRTAARAPEPSPKSTARLARRAGQRSGCPAPVRCRT